MINFPAIFLWLMLTGFGHSQYVIELYNIVCEITNKTYGENFICEIKSLSRGVQVVNIHGDLLVKLEDKIIMNIEVTSKTSTNSFKNVVFNISANLCGNVFETPLLRMITPLIDKYAPGIIHECPYLPQKEFGLHNFVVDANLLPLLPIATFDRVDYRVHTTYTDKYGVLVMKITLYVRFGPKRIRKKKTTVGPN